MEHSNEKPPAAESSASEDVEARVTATEGGVLKDILEKAGHTPALIIGTSSCPFCVEADSILSRYGVQYEFVCLDKEPSTTVGWRKECQQHFKHKTVPIVFVTGEFIGGCDELKALERSGQLAQRLAPHAKSGKQAAGFEHAAVHVPLLPSQDKRNVFPIRPLLFFPDLVDSWVARLTAGFISAVAITSIPLRNNTGMHFAVMGLMIDFIIRFAAGPGPSPMAMLARTVLALIRFRQPPKLVQGFPKQFAQFIGVMCSMLGTIFYFIDLRGTRIAGAVIMAMLAFFAALECLLDFCAGCWFFGLMVNMGLVPKSVYSVGVDAKSDMMYMWEYGNAKKALPKPALDVYPAQANKQSSRMDFIRKTVDQEDHERFDSSILRHTRAKHFQLSTAVLALAAMWKFASFEGYGYSITTNVYKVLTVFGVVLWFATSVLYLVRAIAYPRKVYKEWMCPVNSNSFSVIAMTFLLLAFLVNGIWGDDREVVRCFLGICHSRSSQTTAKVLFWMGAPAALALAYVRVGNLVADRNSYEAVNAGWLIMPISLFLSVIVGCYVDSGTYTQPMYLWFGFGVIMWLPLWVMTFHKAVISHNSDERLRPLLSTWVASAACLSIAWAVLQAAESGSANGAVALDAFGKILYFGSLGLLFTMAWGFVRGFYGRNRFDFDADWSWVFPLAVLTINTILYEGAVDGNFTMGLVYIGLGITSWVTVLLSLQTIMACINGQLWRPEQKWGPLSIMRLTHEAFRSALPKLSTSLAAASPDAPGTVHLFVQQWTDMVSVLDAHSQHEDKVIFATFNQYFPGVANPRNEEHEAQHKLLDSFTEAVLNLSNDGHVDAALLQRLQKQVPAFLVDLDKHLRDEEMALQPIGRKILPPTVHEQLLRKIFLDVTSAEEWRVFMPWVLNNLPMLPQKVRFIRCFTWAVPEWSQLIGRMIADGVDAVTWIRLVEHVPEIIPRGVPGHKRYF